MFQEKNGAQSPYYKRMQKKIAGKPPPAQVIMERTFGTACMVLNNIANIPFPELTRELFFFCRKLPSKELARQFEAQLELAGANPERFIFGLHSFYNDLVAKVRKNKAFPELFDFIGAVERVQVEGRTPSNTGIIDAYTNMVLQMLEYLRPSKFALDTFVYGISTGGELLTGSGPYPYFDIFGIRQQRMASGGKPGAVKALDMYNRQIQQEVNDLSLPAIARITEVQQIHFNMVASLLPFINEFTWDIAPINSYNSNIAPLFGVSSTLLNPNILSQALLRRKRTLPTNGVSFEIEDPGGEAKELLLKELLYMDRVHVLYRADFQEGSLSGYYDTGDGFFYSVLGNSTAPESAENLEVLVLAAYASQVLSPADAPDLGALLFRDGVPLSISPFGRGGKLRDIYHGESVSKERNSSGPRAQKNYNRENRSINGFIRRLPAGQTASGEAVAMAARYGYDLAPNETYVRPFIRASLVKKTPE